MTAIEPVEKELPEQKQPGNKSSGSFTAVLTSTFITIFFAEMGDKTQLATLLISAESQSPWVVFAGAAAALIATSLLGVLLGYWLAKRLSPKVLDIAVAILLLVISGLLLGDVVGS
ncbi:MAG: TMEM165/GDT1 family protein [Gomphosphaeria aponina SAG 52.96 = DSM 107014]|uniref:GDT1 family protein n=1 Tax=Gomphosphaeria aponina SAG 52.96 = DSM 107014 TaxID=1521640 RepID=A0A941GNV5_9CHRO|nr:TMEM165/GDT1 family protein [Gomphosphaeria aponina SAG 52.96 = DSM 107014]